MYGLYDTEGILRFVNSDKEACLAYAELFELSSTNYFLMHLVEYINTDKKGELKLNLNLDLNLEENNN